MLKRLIAVLCLLFITTTIVHAQPRQTDSTFQTPTTIEDPLDAASAQGYNSQGMLSPAQFDALVAGTDPEKVRPTIAPKVMALLRSGRFDAQILKERQRLNAQRKIFVNTTDFQRASGGKPKTDILGFYTGMKVSEVRALIAERVKSHRWDCPERQLGIYGNMAACSTAEGFLKLEWGEVTETLYEIKLNFSAGGSGEAVVRNIEDQFSIKLLKTFHDVVREYKAKLSNGVDLKLVLSDSVEILLKDERLKVAEAAAFRDRNTNRNRVPRL